MWNLIARLVGLLFALFGAGLLAYLTRVFYATGGRWLDVLVAVGMPTMLLLTLIGVASLVAGLALLFRRHRLPDAPMSCKFAHARPPRSPGKASENKG